MSYVVNVNLDYIIYVDRGRAQRIVYYYISYDVLLLFVRIGFLFPKQNIAVGSNVNVIYCKCE